MAFNLEEFAKSHKMHAETESYLKAKQEEGSQPYHLLDIDVARANCLEDSKKFGGTVDFEGGIEKEFVVPSIYNKEGVPVTTYRSKACDGIVCPPIVVYFHGGGNVVGSRLTHSNVCRILSRDAPCVVVNVEYRLAPEHRFPASHDDAKCAVRWVAMNKSLVGGVNKSVVGVCGDSAGGRLAATVSHELHDVVGFTVLVYPVVHFMSKFKSNDEFATGPVLSKETREWFRTRYVLEKYSQTPRASPLLYEDFSKLPPTLMIVAARFRTRYVLEKDSQTPRASPLLYEDFSKLPPTLMIVAELDPLRDGCYAYYEKCKRAGVKAQIMTLKGVPHGFWKFPGQFVDNCKRAHEKASKFIKANS